MKSNARTDTVGIPDWVPTSVKRMAAVLENGKDVQRRLLTDQRMESVWRVLLSEEVNKAYLDSLSGYRRLSGFDIAEDLFSLPELACASFYSFATQEMTSPRAVLTTTTVADSAKQWIEAATACEDIWSYDYQPLSDKRLADALALSSLYLRACAGDLLQRNNSPYFLKRSSKLRGEDNSRVRARALAAETRKIFKRFLCGTLATVVTVALDVKGVTAKSIENWCADLPV